MLHSLRNANGQFRKKGVSVATAYEEYAKSVDKEARLSTPAPPPKMKRETYSLNEGDVTISCPAKLSWKSSNELEEIFKLFIKRVEKGS